MGSRSRADAQVGFYIRLLYALPSCVGGLFGLLLLKRMRASG